MGRRVHTESPIYRSGVRRRRVSAAAPLGWIVGVVAAFILLVALVGVAFAGSSTTLAEGTTIAGIDVGGMAEGEATRMLGAKSRSLEQSPVSFTAAGRSFRLSASQLGVRADWQAAVRQAAAAGDGARPLRGLRRLRVRFFGAHVQPRLTAYPDALSFELDRIAAAVNRPSIDAALVRHGLSVSVQPGHPGTRIDRGRTSETIVSELGSLDRTATVALAVASTTPSVRQTDLREAAVQAQTALSAPIRLAYGETRWKLPRWRIAPLLQLPSGGSTHVTIGGPGADRYLERLSHTLARKPQDARFQVTAAGKIVIVPSQPGLELDPSATARAIGVAAFSSTQRTAQLVARVDEPKRSTEQARKMGITDAVSSYTTTYGGTPGRLHNVQLVAQLIDGALVAPDGTFSFNGTTGERTAEKGFEVAPVIINGELQNGLGGGICQVSTTVFNTAYEAGLPITARTNHALYISHYPLGRDATVNYPDLDLKFRNDTGHWLLLRTFVGSGSLTVNLYGTPVHRRVESSTAPLRVTGSVQVKQIKDPTLKKGKRKVETTGTPPLATSVERKVYDADGKLLYDDTWRSSYVGEPTIVRVGTKKPPKPKPAQNAANRGGPPVASEAPVGTSSETAPPVNPVTPP